MGLGKLRKKIDKIDREIVVLLNQRAAEVIKVSKHKKDNNIATYAPEREATMLRRLKAMNRGAFSNEDLDSVFREILSACRSQRTLLEIVYLGPPGTFTHLAAIKKFGKKPNYIPAESISDVFDKVERKEADYGVVPVENTTEGVVNYTLDKFFVSSLNICAELTLGIDHHLLVDGVKDLKSIKRIYSHPQVFPQCRQWIAQSMPHAELIPTSSTAKAAIRVKKDRSGACIGNKILADIYDLNILVSTLEDSPHNYTRFIVIGRQDSKPSGKDKTSILFAVKDRVGALYAALYAFKSYKINLTKIESRPSKRKPWEYYFFVDFEKHRNSLTVKKALSKLEKECIFLKVLGSYPKES
jgi:chorismate mutase / prephenate dehydratase